MLQSISNRAIVFLLFLTALPFNYAYSAVKLPKLISDGMVLQRDTKIKIWGWANAGESVNITFNGLHYKAITLANGTWSISTLPMKAGGPYTMEISGENHLIINNILIGDVWVCSGQSNMELPVGRVAERYPNLIANSANANIREFAVSNKYVFTAPQDDVAGGAWVQAGPETVSRFTATGYFFALSLYQKYHVPIGLIKSCVGGTPVQAWLSEQALKPFPGYMAIAEKYKNEAYIDSINNANNSATNNWNNNINQNDAGLTGNIPWYHPSYDASLWPQLQMPGYWDNQGLKSTNGVVWLRKEINLPANFVPQVASLSLGRIVDQDFAYVNGTLVGTTGYQYPPRRYTVPAGLLKPGKNVIVVRVINNAGMGGFVPDKPYQLKIADNVIDLSGSWQYKLGFASPPMPSTVTIQYQPLGLYNGMIAPLLNYKIKGVIWYQGESNTSNPSDYYQLFTALITNWRQNWNQGNFPFLYVQLANYMETKNSPSESNWAQLREAQLKALSLPNTGMAVITDLGEWNDVHPTNKADVGNRLALAAQKIAYHNNHVVYSGPVYTAMKINGDRIVLSFNNTGSGLMIKGGGELKYFAIAGADKKFVWAKAKIEGKQIIVWNDAIKYPVAVRYAWADNPEGANLYNKEGLPATSFQTE